VSTSLTLRNPLVAIIALCALAVGACQPLARSLPEVPGDLADSAWPVVSDDLDPDRVVDATQTLITRYLATTDTITQQGGEGPGRMAVLTTASWFPAEEAAFAHYRRQGLRTIGATVFDSLVIQSVSTSVTGSLHVDAVVCVDASWVWLLPIDAPDPPDGLLDWLGWDDEGMEMSDEEFEEWSQYLEDVSPIPGEREAIVVWLVGQDLSSLAIDGTVNWEGAHRCHITVAD